MNRLIVALTIASISGISAVVVGQQAEPEGTFSIVARDLNSGELGMAVQSKALATGSRTITIKGGVGVVAHQSQSNPMYGTLGLELLTTGMSPQQALDLILRSDEGRNTRQVAIIDAAGRTAAWTGSEALDWKGHQCGPDFCAQGNILTGPEVVQAIAKAFESTTGSLPTGRCRLSMRARRQVATLGELRPQPWSWRNHSPARLVSAIVSLISEWTIIGHR